METTDFRTAAAVVVTGAALLLLLRQLSRRRAQKKRDARRSLSEFKQPQDVTCIVEMPTSDAITRFDLWFENFSEEEVVEITKPPPQLLVQPLLFPGTPKRRRGWGAKAKGETLRRERRERRRRRIRAPVVLCTSSGGLKFVRCALN